MKTLNFSGFQARLFLVGATAFLLIAMSFLFTPNRAEAATYYSVANGNWNATATWSTTDQGAAGAGPPVAGDTVYITRDHTVTVNVSNAACATLLLGKNTGNSAHTGTLTFSGTTPSLTVSGNVRLGGNSTTAGSTGTITFTSGASLSAGSLTLGSTGGGGSAGVITMTAGGTLSVGGITVNTRTGNTWTPGTGTVVMTATNTLPTTIFTNFNNLTTSGGTTTTAGNLTIAGNLIVGTGAGLTVAANNTLGVTGTTSVTGTFTLAGTGTKTFTGNVTVNNGGTWNETGIAAISFAGNLQNDGSFTANTGTHTFSGATKTLSGANAISIPSASISGSYTNNGTLTVSTTLAGAGSLTQGTNATLNIGATAVNFTLTTLTAAASGNTVNYNGTGAQTIRAINYNNLTISGAHTTNNVTLANSGTIGVAGTFSLIATFTSGTYVTTGSTVSFNGSGAQTIPASPAIPPFFTYNNLQTATGGTKTTSSGTTTVNGALTIGSGTTLLANAVPSTITLNSTLVNSGVLVIDANGNGCNIGDAKITVSGTATWSGTGSFQLSDISMSGQTNIIGENIPVYHGSGSGNSGFDFVSDCTGAPAAYPTAVKLKFFDATDYDGKVLLQWSTGEEVNNLGFHLYREENGIFTRLTPGPVAGSALLAGRNVNLRAGRSYSWWDDSLQGVQSRTVRYWVEDLDISGKRSTYGPVTPVPSQSPIPAVEQAALLSRLAKVNLSQVPRQKPRFSKASIEPLQPMSAVSSKKPQEVQWALAGATAVKLFVQEEGWYRITQPQLTAYGLDKADPRHFQIYVEGQEVPIVIKGQNDRHFDSGDAIEFYGTGLDTASTDTRTYWLVVGSKRGKRVSKALAGVGGKGTQIASSFLFTVESKPRVIYFPALNNGEGNNKFFGPLISTNAADPTILSLNVNHPDPSPPGGVQLRVALQGVTDGQHPVNVALNDQPLGQVTFTGQNQGVLSLELSQGVLKEGDNQVKLVSMGGDIDISLVDTVRLSYYHTFMADDDALRFTANGGAKLSIGGFSTGMISVMDITDPLNVEEVPGHVDSQGSAYQISIHVPGKGVRTLLAFAEEWIKEVAGITHNSASSWNSSANGADMVIISHSDFLGSLGPLKQFRESQGYSVALIDVEDLYDEFSFGNKTPQAMRDFLSRASSAWQKAPKYVLLGGNGSADPRNYLGYGTFDLVPTRLIQTRYNETASDDWFVDFNGDGLPEMAIGRIPVRTSTEAAAVVSKIVGYEQSPASGWTKEVLLVADIPDTFDFEAASAQVGTLLPDSITVKKIYRSSFANDELANETLLDSIDQGALLVNYLGHGSEANWQGDLITTDDVYTLTNGLSLPFFINMTCWNGWFADPYAETLGESLLKASNGGAVAVWASSGLTEPDGQLVMNEQLIQLLFGGQLTLGEAVAKAKAAVSDMDIRRTWIFLGDPATRLK